MDGIIEVPFVYQSALSGIGTAAIHERVWYKRDCIIPDEYRSKRVFLHFGAVDYKAVVYINGFQVGTHVGGYTPFQIEITSYCGEGSVTIAVEVEDQPDPAQPRGKQYWTDQPDRCWYTASTGIWQSVWLEAVDGTRILSAAITPDIDHEQALFAIETERFRPDQELEILVTYKGNPVSCIRSLLSDKRVNIWIPMQPPDYIDELHYWTPENPHLYDVTLRLYEGNRQTDEVQTYFGMRKIAVENGRIMLNNQPIYLKMVLDQGYWKNGELTAPTDEALEADVRLIKAMGFNGVRKHQKIEDPRFYYWADKLGLLVWGEMPSAYQYGRYEIAALTRDLQEFVGRDFNHPCIMAWVPLNESWGVRKMRDSCSQQNFGRSLYYLLKALDGSRLVCTNDGWESVTTDIVGIHDYAPNGASFSQKYGVLDASTYPMFRRLYAVGENPEGHAAIMTEFGGKALAAQTDDVNWGYNSQADSETELIDAFAEWTAAIRAVSSLCGYCYTQLSDVHQEVNGLLDHDHVPKVELSSIAAANFGAAVRKDGCL